LLLILRLKGHETAGEGKNLPSVFCPGRKKSARKGKSNRHQEDQEEKVSVRMDRERERERERKRTTIPYNSGYVWDGKENERNPLKRHTRMKQENLFHERKRGRNSLP